MHNRFYFILLIICFVKINPSSAPAPYVETDYCKIKNRCQENPDSDQTEGNTICFRKGFCAVQKNCTDLGITIRFREYMIDRHNYYRNLIAGGNDARAGYPNPGATNMRALSYDLELEYLALCYSNRCKGLQHDMCMASSRYTNPGVGQNIMRTMSRHAGVWRGNATTYSIPYWYNETKDMTDVAWIKDFQYNALPHDGKQRGHFTQLAWAETVYVGCARSHIKENFSRILVCNYGNAGNIRGMAVYKLAKSKEDIASECGEVGKSKVWPNLCGDAEPIPTDPDWVSAPQNVNKNLKKLDLSLPTSPPDVSPPPQEEEKLVGNRTQLIVCAAKGILQESNIRWGFCVMLFCLILCQHTYHWIQ